MLSTILQVLIALPKILQYIKEAFNFMQKLQDADRLRKAKEANEARDNIELEKQLGSTTPGGADNVPGSILRPKKP